MFTRVGAADNLSRGDSTFMVEMRETANILAKATRRSLVILDEVGRGTSTFDGVSIAWAVAEHLHDAIGARTLFATHYHELVALADSRPRVRNVSVAVREHKGEIVFLRRVVAGRREQELRHRRRAPRRPAAAGDRARARDHGSPRGRLGSLGDARAALAACRKPAPSPVVARIAALDIDRMTPLEALQLLAELKKLICVHQLLHLGATTCAQLSARRRSWRSLRRRTVERSRRSGFASARTWQLSSSSGVAVRGRAR